MKLIVADVREHIIEQAHMARKHRLYVPGWVMRTIYSDWMECPDMIMANDRLAVMYHDSRPIGAATFTIQGTEAMVYVKPDYRRRGIGTKLIQSATSHVSRYDYGHGIRGSDQFWPTITTWQPTL